MTKHMVKAHDNCLISWKKNLWKIIAKAQEATSTCVIQNKSKEPGLLQELQPMCQSQEKQPKNEAHVCNCERSCP